MDIETNPMTDPWDWYIYLHENHKNAAFHVGKYSRPMDPTGFPMKNHPESETRRFAKMMVR